MVISRNKSTGGIPAPKMLLANESWVQHPTLEFIPRWTSNEAEDSVIPRNHLSASPFSIFQIFLGKEKSGFNFLSDGRCDFTITI